MNETPEEIRSWTTHDLGCVSSARGTVRGDYECFVNGPSPVAYEGHEMYMSE